MTSPTVLKSKRGVMALAISLLMLIGGFALIAPMEEADAATPVATLYVSDGSTYNQVGEYDDFDSALTAYNGQSAGDYLIELNGAVNDPSKKFEVKQLENKNLVLDGKNNDFCGEIRINGRTDLTSPETLHITNFNFKGTLTTEQNTFIWSDASSGTTRYPHNVTVDYCNFTLGDNAVGIKMRQGQNILIENCKANGGLDANLNPVHGGHSLFQGRAIVGLAISDCEVYAEKGISVGNSMNVDIERCTIDAWEEYGIRIDGDPQVETTVSISDCSVEAYIPVSIRKATTTKSTVVFDGQNDMTAENSFNVWLVVDPDEFDIADTSLPTINSGDEKVTVVVGGTGDKTGDVHGVKMPVGIIASVTGPDGAKTYTDLRNALSYVNTNPTKGTYTLTLLADVTDTSSPFTIEQREGVNIILDGADKNITGQIFIDGNSRFDKQETVIIKNINFDGDLGSSLTHYYIENNNGGGNDGYPHNVTISDCKFTMPDGDNSYVGIRLRQAYDIVVERCEFTGGACAYWGTGGTNLGFVGLKVSNVVEGGLSLGTTVGEISIEGCEITGSWFAIRADANLGGTTDLSITDCDFTANVPVTIRNTPTGTYNVTLDSDTTMTPNNPENYWIVASDTAYYGNAGTTPSSSKEVNVTAPSTVPVFVHEHITSCVNTVCGCGEPITGIGHQYDTSATCIARTCIVCTTHIEPADTVNPVHDWDSQYSCCAEECLQCHIAYPTPTDHQSNATFPCMDGVCTTCGMDMPADSDHTPDSTYPCKVTKCTVCLTPLDADPCSRMNDDPCVDSECMYCGDEMPATADHVFGSTATCINRVCSVCDTTTLATTDHDYRISGHQKVCSMCGDTVNLPIQEDDDDDWYDWWLAQQAAKAEAERIAQEQAEEEEAKKKVTAVAVAVGAAVAMVLLLMTTPRN